MSIKKVAEKAGVSPATVSRVLNNPNYKCSVPGLRDKIWKTAIEMNYVPNEAARNLKRGVSAKREKTWYINILMTRTDSSQTDPFFAELLRVIESEIHDKNCILSDSAPSSFDDSHRVLSSMPKLQASGAIQLSAFSPFGHLRLYLNTSDGLLLKHATSIKLIHDIGVNRYLPPLILKPVRTYFSVQTLICL